ncbi:MAG TPA: HD domain-containing protein [Bacteroidetes bacterium]|nr:HD domain-containing protein [Bacteroidota bacterium]
MKLLAALDLPVFEALRETARETGLKCYVIGGFVRDHLLNRPSKDIDVVVEGRGIDLAKAFAKRIGADRTAYYENFGTAMVGHENFEVEFVGARKESYNRGSRKPVVEEGTLEDDQVRRDFTINAMSISLNEQDFGELYDPFGGVDDLKNGIIRTPTDPQITFSDDPLRILRAIRFATQLDFFIEEATLSAIGHNRDRLKIVSQERITDELNKVILAKVPSKGFKILFDTKVLHLIFPDMVKLYGVEFVNGRGHKDNFYHTLQVLDNLSEMSDDLWLRWAAILHDIAKPATKRYYAKQGWTFHGHEDMGARWVPRIFKQFRLPLDSKMKFVQKLVKLHLRPIALVNDIVTDSGVRRLIVDAGEDLNALMTLCRADITTRNASKMKRILRNFDAVEQKIEAVAERDNLRNWQPPVTGEMIMEMFSIPPSRMIGLIKNAVREAILEGDCPNEEGPALEYTRRIGKEILAQKKKK